jgi:hypothetical protein
MVTQSLHIATNTFERLALGNHGGRRNVSDMSHNLGAGLYCVGTRKIKVGSIHSGGFLASLGARPGVF